MDRVMAFTVFAFALFLGFANAGTLVGTSAIHAPAVLVSNNTGVLTTFTLSVYSGGNGTVLILGPSSVGLSTNQSAEIAAQYASAYLGFNFSHYNFNYSILNTSGNVSGPSGGAAMAMLALSALSGKPLLDNFTMTGTISLNGTIGPVGGVYDKTAAAKAANLSFILAPEVPSGSIDNELYFLAQDLFKIPIVQVINISDAYKFAFGIVSPTMRNTTFTFYTPLNLSVIPVAQFRCSNNCYTAPFGALVNATIAKARSEINKIAQPTFLNVATQLRGSVSQLPALVQKGYLYPAGDLAFLAYLHAFYFDNYETSTAQGLSKLNSIGAYCSSITIPNLTRANYEYVLTGEIRQQWAEYTINATEFDYNSTIQTSDDVLYAMRLAASAYVWCTSAQMLYNASLPAGTPVTPSKSLSNLANARIARAELYGSSMYLTAAQDAMAVNNYPLAILQADYAYAITNASETNLTTGQLINVSSSLVQNATYGLWATQFSNEAELYISQAKAERNTSSALGDAQNSYTSALLAQQFNTDMRLISANLTNGSSTQQIFPNATTVSYLSGSGLEATIIGLGIAAIAFAIVLYILIRVVSGRQPPQPPVPAGMNAPAQKRRKRKR